MIDKKLILTVLICSLFMVSECQKKSSKRLKQMMEKKEIDDKIFDEKIRKEMKEREETIAKKYKPGILNFDQHFGFE